MPIFEAMPAPANKPKTIFRWFLIAIFTTALLFSTVSNSGEIITLEIGGLDYKIELARTVEQRRLGLMNRQLLGPRQGMLLIYPHPGDRRIWMKNVPIPLQVYWIDDAFVVIDTQKLEPCSEDPCPVYDVDAEAKYVLELGEFEHPLTAGDQINSLRDL